MNLHEHDKQRWLNSPLRRLWVKVKILTIGFAVIQGAIATHNILNWNSSQICSGRKMPILVANQEICR